MEIPDKFRRTFARLRRTRGAARAVFIAGLPAILAALGMILMLPAPQASRPIVAYNDIGAFDVAEGLASSPWPMFHQNLRHTGLSPYNTSGNNGSQKWKLATGEVQSSPAVGADGTIYVGAYYSLWAINPDGTEKWTFPTGLYVSSSPALAADGTIYVGSVDDNLYAINSDGSQKWKFTTDGSVYSSPAIGTDGTIYVGSDDDNLYAINSDGSQKWKFTTGSDIENASPAIGGDGTIYIGSQDGNFYAVGVAGIPTATATASPTATPTAVPAKLSVAPAKLNFGNVDATGTSKPKELTLTDKGTSAAEITNITASAPFIIGGTDTCTGQTIKPKKHCSFGVEFAPTTVADITGGSVDVIYNGTSPKVRLAGDGIAVTLKAPKSSSLGTVAAGGTGKPKTLELSNPSTVSVMLGTGTLGGTDPGSFQLASDQCSGKPLAAEGKCAIEVEFAPPGGSTSGTQSATLSFSFTYGTNNGDVSTSLSGKV